MAYTIEVNGLKRTVDVDGDTPLLWVLRDELDLKGTKFGCGVGLYGDGEAARMASYPLGRTVQGAWMDLDVPQCGYCQTGQIMSAIALLSRNPDPADHEIDDAMSGNVCRCCTYLRIRGAIKRATHIHANAAEAK